jgi:ubiquinone/menaquinone biosynthesis C-methylase UbiE
MRRRWIPTRTALIIDVSGRIDTRDRNPGMIAIARDLPAPAGAPIRWREGDATSLPYPGATTRSARANQLPRQAERRALGAAAAD